MSGFFCAEKFDSKKWNCSAMKKFDWLRCIKVNFCPVSIRYFPATTHLIRIIQFWKDQNWCKYQNYNKLSRILILVHSLKRKFSAFKTLKTIFFQPDVHYFLFVWIWYRFNFQNVLAIRYKFQNREMSRLLLEVLFLIVKFIK